jgi:hypothetical protein
VPILGTPPLGRYRSLVPTMTFSRAVIERQFGDLWPVHNRAFINLIIECRRLFDGDLDQMLILAVIGDRALVSKRVSGLDYEQFVSGERGTGRAHRINTQSIAESTGIPRETVRRKIRLLVKRDWLERCEDGTWRVTEKAVADLAPATKATFDYLVTIGRALMTRAAE